jgi:8-oxo-dGTP pyrophosphatase MutT (NUDIX family)/phosphohistidine phosphatase SixA
MGDRPPADEVRAAGAVVWRPASSGAQVVLVHRPKYDDWSLPKGKLEPGEHVLLAAVREVAEETALEVTLGRRLPPVQYVSADVTKRVDYWVATAAGVQSAFEPTSEIDEVAWLAASSAPTCLSYERDVELLADFRAGPGSTLPLILLRHASAGSKSDWTNSDASRPLDDRGTEDALALAPMLRCFGAGRVVSAPAERCVATVRPYAASIGGVVEIEPAFDVGGSSQDGRNKTTELAAAMARLAADSRPVVVCAHRENLPALLAAAFSALGAASQSPSGKRSSGKPEPGKPSLGKPSLGKPSLGKPLHKGEFAVLHRAAGNLVALERYHPDGDLIAGRRPPRRPVLEPPADARSAALARLGDHAVNAAEIRWR